MKWGQDISEDMCDTHIMQRLTSHDGDHNTFKFWTFLTSINKKPVKNKTLRQHSWFIFSHWNFAFIRNNMPAAFAFGIHLLSWCGKHANMTNTSIHLPSRATEHPITIIPIWSIGHRIPILANASWSYGSQGWGNCRTFLTSINKKPVKNQTLRQNSWFKFSHWNFAFIYSNIPAASGSLFFFVYVAGFSSVSSGTRQW
jgi:hypothetical protein